MTPFETPIQGLPSGVIMPILGGAIRVIRDIASEILFNLDYKAYKTEHKAFKEAEPELAGGDES